MKNTTTPRHPHDQRGSSLVEYALLVALIAVVCIAAVTALGKRATNTNENTTTTEYHVTTTEP